GVTMQLPEADKHTYTKEYLESQIAVMMGGRVAEEIFLKHQTTGAGNDIEQATELARRMVCEWGMSDLGPITFGKKEEQIFLGREIAQHRDYSEDTAIRIDQGFRHIVDSGYQKAKSLVTEHSDTLVRIAEALLEREVLDAHEVKLIIQGLPLPEKKRVVPQPVEPQPQTQQVLKPGPVRNPDKAPPLAEGEKPAHA
ncbi:MAG: cell division protein FtsH, partial [bacterium]|nr:cell division protein FtsH [bacterium]